MQKYKIAFVGQPSIHEAFKEFDESWDMQIPLATLDDFERELASDEPRISPNTNVVIVFSRLFNKAPAQFARVVATVAPYSVTCVLIPQADRAKYGTELERAIRQTQIEMAEEDDEYNNNTPFYLVDYENAQSDIYNAISEYVKSPIIEPEIKDAIRPMLPNGGDLTDDDFEDFSEYEDDEILIPEAGANAKGKVFTITSSKGGSGKSTVAISLGAFIALSSEKAAQKGLISEPLKVCLVDLDTRDGQHWILTGARKPSTIMNLIGKDEIDIEDIKETVWHSENTHCDYLFAPKRPKSALSIPSNLYAKTIQKLREIYDVIILDTSAYFMDSVREDVAYQISEKIVFVSDIVQTSILGCTRWISEEMHEPERGDLNIPSEKVGIVINKSLSDVGMSAEKIQRATNGLPILSMIPSEPKLVAYACNTCSLEQILRRPLINQAIRYIAEALLPDTPFESVFI